MKVDVQEKAGNIVCEGSVVWFSFRGSSLDPPPLLLKFIHYDCYKTGARM